VATMRRLIALAALALSLSCSPVAMFRYETSHKIRVYTESRSVSRSDVEAWTLEAYAIWLTLRPDWDRCIGQVMRHGLRVDLDFADAARVQCRCGPDGSVIDVLGYTEPGLDMTLADSGYDMQILTHEIGHVLAYVCEGVWGEGSHQLFKRLGFPWM